MGGGGGVLGSYSEKQDVPFGQDCHGLVQDFLVLLKRTSVCHV